MAKRVLIIAFFSVMLVTGLKAQDDRSSEKNLLYEHSYDFGILVHTRGFGAFAQFTKQRTAVNHQLLEFNVFELHHPKEMALPNPAISGSQAYVFGKLNNLVVLSAGYGTRYVIADRNNPSSIKIDLNYTFGPILGMFTPIYYNVRLLSSDGMQTQIVEAKFDPNNLNYQTNTIGPTAFPKGLNESFFIPGAFAKTGLNFEWGRADYKYYSLEAGVMVDAFPVPVPIFATIKNDQVFVNLYLSIAYGIRK